jgi:hypothetical protein
MEFFRVKFDSPKDPTVAAKWSIPTNAMKSIVFRMLGHVGGLVDVHPVIALLIGGALLTVFLTVLLRVRPSNEAEPKGGLLWLLYRHTTRVLWALTLVGVLAGSLSLLRIYLRDSLAAFQRNHGRITDANYHAVETIWGTQQEQVELQVTLFYEEEVTERFESEDMTKPAVLRKKLARHEVPTNPFLTARHEVTLKQNPRKKGSAMYGGYETACLFQWNLRNMAGRNLNSTLKFPLPSASGMYNDLIATLNGKDVLPQMQLKDGVLLLNREWDDGENLDLKIAFTSRGMSSWYFQVREPREIRDFTLTLTLPDIPKSRLNNPEGCMSPTAVKPTADKLGSVLTYRLDHAISSKGMGVALPPPPQPGATTSGVLAETERAWLLIYATMIFGLVSATLGKESGTKLEVGANSIATQPGPQTGIPTAVLLCIVFGTATACSYAMVADFSDILFGFWGTAAVVLLPMFLLLAWLLKRVVPGRLGRLLVVQLFLFGLLYPTVAGLDTERQSLYFNLCALAALGFIAVQWIQRNEPDTPGTFGAPVQTVAAAG